MYTKDGESYFIVDAHVALWDAREENLRNVHGKQFIDCFYDYHRNLSPESEVWSYEEYLYQGGARLMKDLFEDGYVDHAIFQPALLSEFYVNGFGQTEEASALAAAHPDKKGEKPPRHEFLSARDLGLERIARKGLERLKWEFDRYEPVALSVYAGRTPQVKAVYAPFRVPGNRLTAGELEATCILAGGDPFSPKEPVAPGVLSAVSDAPVPAATDGRRKAVADWVADPKNPLGKLAQDRLVE